MVFRKITLALLGMLLGLTATAQNEMSVLSFRLLENDLTANTRGTSEMDQNGETAALIKIVTLERGFNFDGGSLGIVGTKEKPGELWLYVPRYAQRLTITHANFGTLRNYAYPVTVEGGRTYEMLIDIGTGRYANISGTVAGAEITIDGEYVGKSPLYNRYLGYGKHTIKAVNNRFEGVDTVYVMTAKDGDPDRQKALVYNVDMRDMSDHYGDIDVTTVEGADIFFQGQKVGTGRWQSQLREGKYILETYKSNCDSVKTAFTVTALKNNVIKATPPTPHTGYLNIYTRPRSLTAMLDGRTPVDLTEAQSVPVGTHAIEFSRKGYISQTREFNVARYQITADTVTLERINYVKSKALYFGLGYTVRTMGGPTVFAGYTYKNHDIQASYTFGTGASDDIHWYSLDAENNPRLSTVNYKMSSIAFKYGYQWRLLTRFAAIPQLGFVWNQLGGNLVDGTEKFGDGASSFCMSLGAKLMVAPVQHFYVFLSPEYYFPLSKDKAYKSISETADLSASGFALHAGLLFNF